ncbi:hypothetical protein K1514_06335 [Paraclostridium bifermentans]|uniref:ORC-CDC6 family AAA ATPase n=1 Tax=Paraclostridium TaxID=1849822 RepID=UPI001CC3CCBB|nr:MULTISPECIES: hypothetical protein [Paraclostridium]MBZ6005499.1 hypothetical protein [Paraclostridium bifermentans]MDU0297641.1 hypothetical protein [Paraclostridium sp. MRS3W1]
MRDLNDDEVKNRINKLSDVIRAEYIDDDNYLELYAGQEMIQSINNIKNQVIYGRRGTGKTHLLRAYQELLVETFNNDKRFPIYIDLRNFLPLMSENNTNTVEFSILIFSQIIKEIITNLVENINFIYGLNEFDRWPKAAKNKKEELISLLGRCNYEFTGRNFKKLDDIELSSEEVNKIAGSLKVSKELGADISKEKQACIKQQSRNSRYISFSDLSNIITEIPKVLGIKRIVCILDEWSEIPLESQLYLAELIKRGFITSSFSFKIAAIPNRTNIGKMVSEKYMGLEDGGDIFPFNLDNRYIYETNSGQTKDFFNDLLYRHLNAIDKKFDNKCFSNVSKSGFLNLFLANQALGEILIASAGIPRDFINIFINAYEHFKINTSSRNNRIGVRHIRLATVDWYKTDKEEQIENISNCKSLLEGIINEIIIKKRKTHFLIPQKYRSNKYLNQLIDFRIIHLRKKGYSHKGNTGIIYDVYSIDYGCYTSIDIPQSKLDMSFINKIDSIDNFREIRRVSLEDVFFDKFLLDTGDGFNCPHCKKTVDINHPAYIKQKICNNCFDKIE